MLLISRLSEAISSNNKRNCCCIRPRAGAVVFVVVEVACLLRLLLAPDLEAVVVVAVAVGARLLVREGLLALDREEVVVGLLGLGGGGGCLVVVPGPVLMGGAVSISASSRAC